MATRKFFIDSPRQVQATTPEEKITKMTARVANLLSVCATSCCVYIIFSKVCWNPIAAVAPSPWSYVRRNARRGICGVRLPPLRDGPRKGEHRTTFLSGQVPNESEGRTAPATWRNSRRWKKGGSELSIDEEAHTSLAYYNLCHAWNWAEAESEFKKAIELNPSYATAHDWYSYYLMAMGRFDEPWKEVNRAHELDPLSVTISTDIGVNYYYRRNYDEAMSQLRATLAISPKFPLAHLWLGRAYQQKRMYAEAIDEFNKTDAALPGWVVTIVGMGHAYGEWGHQAEAKQVLVRLNEMAGEKYVTPYGVALVYAGFGDKDQAFAWLNKAVAGRSHWLVWLNRDPRWDRIRSEQSLHSIGSRYNAGLSEASGKAAVLPL
jgi:tetratricopeptide (TPR) repeat protein